MKKLIFQFIMRSLAKKNMLTTPKIIELPSMQFVGYKITTTTRNNQQKADIPPFYHDVYDNHKLNSLKQGNELNMYCLFDLHQNLEDFDYYVAVENTNNTGNDSLAEIQTPAGKYVKVEFLKRNNKTVYMIMMYMRTIWIKRNGFRERTAPPFILYDGRFHANYQKHGRKGGEYLGKPIASIYLPIED